MSFTPPHFLNIHLPYAEFWRSGIQRWTNCNLHPWGDSYLEHLTALVSKEGKGTNVFVDMSTSLKPGRLESCVEASTCITPTHPIYSAQLGRYLQPKELLGLQAVWRVDAENPAAFDTMANSSLSQDLAGNGMTGTVVQAVFLSALASSHAVVDLQSQCAPPPSSSSQGAADAGMMIVEAESPGNGEGPSPTAPSGRGRKRKFKRRDKQENVEVPARRARGKQSMPMLSVGPPKKKRGVGKGNQNAPGKRPMVSIWDKEVICKEHEKAVARGSKHPAKDVEKLGLKGYYPGCTMRSKWGAIRESQQWSLLCAAAPKLCRAKKELPNSLRRVIQYKTLKRGTAQTSEKYSMLPFALKQVVEEMVSERIDLGEEVGLPFVQNTIVWCTNLWNESIDTIRNMIAEKGIKMLKDQDAELAKLPERELDDLFGSIAERADKVLVPVKLCKTDGALQSLVGRSKWGGTQGELYLL